MNTYKATMRKAGGYRRLLDNITFYGTFAEATEQFMSWALDWLGNRNDDEAIELHQELVAKNSFTEFELDGTTYAFTEVIERTCQGCGNTFETTEAKNFCRDCEAINYEVRLHHASL